jgi:hypothetical protein
MNWKGSGRYRSQPNFRDYCITCVWELRKATKRFSQDNRSPGINSNQWPPAYATGTWALSMPLCDDGHKSWHMSICLSLSFGNKTIWMAQNTRRRSYRHAWHLSVKLTRPVTCISDPVRKPLSSRMVRWRLHPERDIVLLRILSSGHLKPSLVHTTDKMKDAVLNKHYRHIYISNKTQFLP